MKNQIRSEMKRLENLVNLCEKTDWNSMEPHVKDNVLTAYETIIGEVQDKIKEIHLAVLLENI